jgi:hypothetical protein
MLFLVISQRSDRFGIHPVVAADRTEAADKVRDLLRRGVPEPEVSVPFPLADPHEVVRVAIVEVAVFGTVAPDPDQGPAQITYTNQHQLPINDLPAFTVTTLAHANTALQAIRTSHNELLARLRAAGTIRD